MTTPRQGEVWLTALDPVVGSEIAKTRPALVVSVDNINTSPLGIVIVAAITTTPGEPGVRIELPQGCGQPRRISYVLPYQVRTISHQRLIRRVAYLDAGVQREVVRRLAVFTRVTASPVARSMGSGAERLRHALPDAGQ